MIINYLNTSCGVVNLYRTIIEDIEAVYLFSVQLNNSHAH